MDLWPIFLFSSCLPVQFCFHQENDLYRIISIHNNITTKTIISNGLVLFECLEYFSNSEKESSLSSIEALDGGKYLRRSLLTTGILLASAVPTLVKYLVNSFAISISFTVIPCLLFIALGRELDFFSVSLLFLSLLAMFA